MSFNDTSARTPRRFPLRRTVVHFGVVLLILFGWSFVGVEGHDWEDLVTEESATAVPLKLEEDYREIQWCVNGVEEPEFRTYPFNEFTPLLTRRHYLPYEANLRFHYEIELRPIKLKMEDGVQGVKKIGSGGNLYQRAHFVLKAKLREEFYHDISLRYRKAKIEGLIVQANYAPHGVGIPFGQFDHPKYFSCVDCMKPLGIPVACRRRSYMHIVHPTIMVFHHKMKPIKEHRDRLFKDCDEPVVKKQCILIGIENKTQEPTTTGPTPTPPSTMETTLVWNKTIMEHHYNRPFFNKGPDRDCTMDSDCDLKVAEWFEENCCLNHKLDPGVTSPICQNKRSLWGFEMMKKPECKPSPSGSSSPPTTSPDCDPTAMYTGAPDYGWRDDIEVKIPCPNVANDFGTDMDPAVDLMLDPSEMSYDWPQFECRAHVVTVCRPPGTDRRVDKPKEYFIDHKTGIPIPDPDVNATMSPPGRFNPLDNDTTRPTECCLGSSPGQAMMCEERNNKTGFIQPRNPCNAKTPGMAETECVKRFLQPIEYDLNNTAQWKFSKSGKTADCSQFLPPKDGEVDEYGKTNETHGMFSWYIPPCTSDPVKVKFEIMVVHSFQFGIYSVVEYDDIFHLKRSPYQKQHLNPYIPTPFFTGFKHMCEEKIALAEYLYKRTSDKRYVMGFSRSYDKCIQNITTNGTKQIHDQTCPGVPFFTEPKIKGAHQKKLRPRDKSKGGLNIPRCDIHSFKEDILKCEAACPELPTSTFAITTPNVKGWFKRTFHGAINIVTNFCIMPICTFIARFYKETYNRQSYKGQRLWFWMHLIGSGASTVLMYMGYFTGRYVEDTYKDPHLMYGLAYIFLLGLSYVTAWMRHKRYWINTIVQFLHSLGGYSSIVLAGFCVYHAKDRGVPINYQVKYIVYASILSLVIFYVGMTIHICILDRRMGMKPRRRHFPSVESKFDDLPVPGNLARRICLYVIIGINLPLTLSTMFL